MNFRSYRPGYVQSPVSNFMTAMFPPSLIVAGLVGVSLFFDMRDLDVEKVRTYEEGQKLIRLVADNDGNDGLSLNELSDVYHFVGRSFDPMGGNDRLTQVEIDNYLDAHQNSVSRDLSGQIRFYLNQR